MEISAFSIPEVNFTALNDRITKLAKKATKLNLTPPTLTIVGQEDVPIWTDINENMSDVCQRDKPSKNWKEIGFNRYFHVVLEGEAPTIPGWNLVAVIDHTTDSEIGNLIRNVPGMECPKKYRNSKPNCDHCNQTRRRHETFIIVDKKGTYKQIGRNCLADFCRDPKVADNMAKYAEFLMEAIDFCNASEEDTGGGFGSGKVRVPLESVLQLSYRLIKGIGWTSRTAAKEDHTKLATADHVQSIMFDPKWKKGCKQEFIDVVSTPLDDEETIITNALEWIMAKKEDIDATQDYIYNLVIVCSLPVIELKMFGLACSLIATYLREQEKLNKPTTISEHFGTLKKREVFILTCVGEATHDAGGYGPRTLFKFADKEGRQATWWTSPGVDMKVGTTYEIKATVKNHSEFKGIKQTDLSRCDVIKEV